ncbi:MAG: hypothetical protein QXF56_00205 [Candidatus Micrarchaeia archaeon]
MKRGFVITVSTLLLFVVILLFIQASYGGMREAESELINAQQIDYAMYIFDDVAVDLKQLLGPDVEIAREGGMTVVKFSEKLPKTANLSEYKKFLANYSEKSNAEIKINTSNVDDGKLIVFGNGLRYDRNSSSFKFYHTETSTNASEYELSVFSKSYRLSENISLLTNNGDVKLVVHYSDLNGSMDLEGAFYSDRNAVYSVIYDGGEMKVAVGNVSGKHNSIELTSSVDMEVNLTVKGEWSTRGYAYDVEMGYEQLNVKKKGLVWVEKS